MSPANKQSNLELDPSSFSLNNYAEIDKVLLQLQTTYVQNRGFRVRTCKQTRVILIL